MSDKLVHPKPIGHRIAPEHKVKPIEEEQPEIGVPTIGMSLLTQLSKFETRGG